MTQRSRLQTALSEQKDMNIVGVDGKFQWPIRIATPLLFIGVLLVNYLLGINRNKQVSDAFHLWVTPPGYYFIIWAVIYTGLIFSNIYNLIRNQWNIKTHIWFAISNIMNIVWTVVFNVGTLTAVVFSSFILFLLSLSILGTWIYMGETKQAEDKNEHLSIWTYINRNIFAFYLGWCIAATNLNFGMDVVYWWGASKQAQMIIFWVLAPMCALGAFGFNTFKWGKQGALSCFVLFASVGWAFAGAGITSYNCSNYLQELC